MGKQKHKKAVLEADRLVVWAEVESDDPEAADDVLEFLAERMWDLAYDNLEFGALLRSLSAPTDT
jgi:hypothetical protein